MLDSLKSRRQTGAIPADASQDEGLRAYLLQIYNLMGIALGVTGLTAWLTASSPALLNMIYGTPLKWLVMFAPLIFAFVLGAKVMSMSVRGATLALVAFAVLMGLSTAWIFLVYTGLSIAKSFFITASLFGLMSMYGYTTDRDLSSWGSFLIMGLIGVILASIVNIFIGSTLMETVISVLVVIICTGLTAYDSQRLKAMYYTLAGNTQMMGRAAVLGALSLYINFLNIFIAILQLTGNER